MIFLKNKHYYFFFKKSILDRYSAHHQSKIFEKQSSWKKLFFLIKLNWNEVVFIT